MLTLCDDENVVQRSSTYACGVISGAALVGYYILCVYGMMALCRVSASLSLTSLLLLRDSSTLSLYTAEYY